MKQTIAIAALAAACVFLTSCTREPRRKTLPELFVEQKPKSDARVVAEKTDKLEKPVEKPLPAKIELPRAFAANLDTEWEMIALDSAKLNVAASKEAVARLEFWENGVPSKRIATVTQSLIAANGQVEIVTHVADLRPDSDSKGYKIEILDGVGSAFFYEFPANTKHFVAHVAREISAKDSTPAPYYYLCVGSDLTRNPGESVHDLAKRVDYAIVLSIGETEKN